MAAPAIKLHHRNLSRSTRVRWLLAELDIPYQLIKKNTLGELKTPEHLALHPLGKAPVLEDGNTVIWESLAVVQYIMEKYSNGRLQPPISSPERAAYLQWLAFGEATLYQHMEECLYQKHPLATPEEQQSQYTIGREIHNLKLEIDVLDRALASRPYLAGDAFSAADIVTGYSLITIHKFLGNGPTWLDLFRIEQPNVLAYMARLQERPGWKTAVDDVDFEGFTLADIK